MKLKRKYKNSSDLNWFSKAVIFFLTFIIPIVSYADPVVAGQVLPPASFTYVENYDTLVKLGLDGSGGAWCYDNDANAILITAAAHEKAKCELTLQYEKERLKTKYELQIKNLNLRIQTLTTQTEQTLLIKDKEIEKLTQTALEKPNNYWYLFAGGGFLVGVVSTVTIVYLVK